MNIQTLLYPDWAAPSHVHAFTTTRLGGQSLFPYDTNNLGMHVGDCPDAVIRNRSHLKDTHQLPREPVWLNQTHGTYCVDIDTESTRDADAAMTSSPNRVLAILTADCLPVIICNQAGTEIAAIHAGWRGLLNGVIENTIARLKSPRESLMAWLGPANCARCYETGSEVREAFLQKDPDAACAFEPIEGGTTWLADMPQLASRVLFQQGLSAVHFSHRCTMEEKNTFYSYRRESQTGRMATLIWFNSCSGT